MNKKLERKLPMNILTQTDISRETINLEVQRISS